MAIQLEQERPPFVAFERRAVEKRKPAPPEGDGTSYYVDEDYAVITPQGSKDKVEKVVHEWFDYLRQMVKMGRYNPVWLEGFEKRYGMWKSGLDLPESGQSLLNWPVITPAQVKTLATVGVRTVEDLAAGNEDVIARLGMGARSLKQKARDWLEAQSGTGPLVQRLDAMKIAFDDLQVAHKNLQEEHKTVLGMLDQYRAQQGSVKSNAAEEMVDLNTRLALAREKAGDPFEEALNKL